eukprot:9503195-Pyramimonas_sp.AAC.1
MLASLKRSVQTEKAQRALRATQAARQGEQKAKAVVRELNKRMMKIAPRLQPGQVPPEFWTAQLPTAKVIAVTDHGAASANMQKNCPFIIKDVRDGGWSRSGAVCAGDVAPR